MGAGTQTTTNNTTAAPYKPARPLINTALNDALGAYRNGIGSQVYTGSTVIPFSNQTIAGMNDIMQNVGQNTGTRGISAQSQDIIRNGGFSDGQLQTMNGMQSLANSPVLNNMIRGNGLSGAQNNALRDLTGLMRNDQMDALMSHDGLSSAQSGALKGLDSLYNNRQFDNIMNRGGLDTYSQQAANNLMGMSQNSNLNRLIRGNGMDSYAQNAMNNWRSTANSNFDLTANPAFQQVQQNAIDQAQNAISRQAAAAGRYGSGTNQQILAREVGNTAASLANNEYRNWQDQRNQANQNMFSGGMQASQNLQNAMGIKAGLMQGASSIGAQGIGNMQNIIGQRSNIANSMAGIGQQGAGNMQNIIGQRGNIANSMAGIGQQGIGNQQNAIGIRGNIQGNLFNAQGQGLNNMQQAYGLGNQPGRDAMSVGSMYEDLATRQLNDQLRLFNEQQNAPWDAIKNLMAVGNMTGQYSPKNTTSTQPGPNPFLQTLGGISSGLGLLGGLF